MRSVKDSVKNRLHRFGIEWSDKEKCNVCNYGTRIIMVVNGKESSHCKYCNDKELIKEMNLPESKEESDERKRHLKAARFSKYPSELEGAMLNNYIAETDEQKKAKQLAVGFIKGFDKERSLVMGGSPGVGKSHIAVSIAKALRSGYSTMFIKSTDLLGLIRESYDSTEYSESDVLKTVKSVDLFILDDIGAEYDRSKGNDSETWASDILYRALDSRLGKSSVITTNYTESQLEEKYGRNGERIVSRMNDKADRIRIFGEDARRK